MFNNLTFSYIKVRKIIFHHHLFLLAACITLKPLSTNSVGTEPLLGMYLVLFTTISSCPSFKKMWG